MIALILATVVAIIGALALYGSLMSKPDALIESENAEREYDEPCDCADCRRSNHGMRT